MDREDINRLIQDNGLFHGTVSIGVIMDMNHLERLVALVAAAEREACAKVCEEAAALFGNSGHIGVCLTNAGAIRARSKT